MVACGVDALTLKESLPNWVTVVAPCGIATGGDGENTIGVGEGGAPMGVGEGEYTGGDDAGGASRQHCCVVQPVGKHITLCG